MRLYIPDHVILLLRAPDIDGWDPAFQQSRTSSSSNKTSTAIRLPSHFYLKKHNSLKVDETNDPP